jgi:hypothetical protein
MAVVAALLNRQVLKLTARTKIDVFETMPAYRAEGQDGLRI